MVRNRVINRELHFLRVDKHKLQLIRVLLVEQGSDDGIQTNRLSLTSSTRYEKMRYLRKVHHVYFVGDSFAECDRQFHLCLLELA